MGASEARARETVGADARKALQKLRKDIRAGKLVKARMGRMRDRAE